MYKEPSYDDYLDQRLREFEESFCDGEPKVIGVEKEYEFTDDDGNIVASDSYIYSCEECDCTECEHYYRFHPEEVEYGKQY